MLTRPCAWPGPDLAAKHNHRAWPTLVLACVLGSGQRQEQRALDAARPSWGCGEVTTMTTD